MLDTINVGDRVYVQLTPNGQPRFAMIEAITGDAVRLLVAPVPGDGHLFGWSTVMSRSEVVA